MIFPCLKIDLGSFWTHLESFGFFLDAFFVFSVQNDPKMTPKLVSAQWWKKMVITIGFLMVWNPCHSEAFVSGGAFDDENLKLWVEVEKNVSQEDPPVWHHWAPEADRKGECFAPCESKWSVRSSAFQARAAFEVFDPRRQFSGSKPEIFEFLNFWKWWFLR